MVDMSCLVSTCTWLTRETVVHISHGISLEASYISRGASETTTTSRPRPKERNNSNTHLKTCGDSDTHSRHGVQICG